MAGSGPPPTLSARTRCPGHFGHSGPPIRVSRDRGFNGAQVGPLGGQRPARNDRGPRNRSMSSKPRYYLTTAIAYPNGPPHIGHAYEVLATDAIARFQRLDGYDVFFLTGTDEHGIKMLQTAAREGVTPRELADRNVAIFRKMVARMDCSNDDYIRTTEPRHYESSKAIWKRM